MVLVCGDIIGNKRKLFVGHHVVWNNNLCLLRPKCSMEPVPVPVHVYIVAPDCFRAEYFKKKLFPHNFSPRQSKTFHHFYHCYQLDWLDSCARFHTTYCNLGNFSFYACMHQNVNFV